MMIDGYSIYSDNKYKEIGGYNLRKKFGGQKYFSSDSVIVCKMYRGLLLCIWLVNEIVKRIIN